MRSRYLRSTILAGSYRRKGVGFHGLEGEASEELYFRQWQGSCYGVEGGGGNVRLFMLI